MNKKTPHSWLLLILSLPGQDGSLRMRVWRALKASGAGILRDGVYLLPETPDHQKTFTTQVDLVKQNGGIAHIVEWQTQTDKANNETDTLIELFNRNEQYQQWQETAQTLKDTIKNLDQASTRKKQTALRRDLESILKLDFFPNSAAGHAKTLMQSLSDQINQQFSPDEPIPNDAPLEQLDIKKFQNKTWTTRADLWVDRVASAWLIKTFIDPGAKFKWFKANSAPLKSAIGFDYNGARFSHIDELVTFEVLIHSFGLENDKALNKLATLIHYLDIGGIAVNEAPGILSVIAGLKTASNDDDNFLTATSQILNGLYKGASD